MTVHKLTAGQRKFLKAVANGTGGIFHRRVVQPVVDAGLASPCRDNLFFWLVGCNGHSASEFYPLPAGEDVLTGQQSLAFAA